MGLAVSQTTYVVRRREPRVGSDVEAEDEWGPDVEGVRLCLPTDARRLCRYDGKVSGIVYDCYGDFEGFTLDDCGREFRFSARESEIEELVTRAWRERTHVRVIVDRAMPRRPLRIVLRYLPSSAI